MTATGAATELPAWQREIDELHEFFEAYFLGSESSLDRVEAALAPDFTIVGAHGVEADRATTMSTLRDAHAHTSTLEIRTTDHALLADAGDLIVAGYVETHLLATRRNDRRSTVVFRRSESAPNGVVWVRVHETWMSGSDDAA